MVKKKQAPGLGDAISVITKYLKIKECDGCKKRKEILNNIKMPKFKT